MFCFIKLFSSAINECHRTLEVSCLHMAEKNVLKEKEITLIKEHDYIDDRENQLALPMSSHRACVLRWNSRNVVSLSSLMLDKSQGIRPSS